MMIMGSTRSKMGFLLILHSRVWKAMSLVEMAWITSGGVWAPLSWVSRASMLSAS